MNDYECISSAIAIKKDLKALGVQVDFCYMDEFYSGEVWDFSAPATWVVYIVPQQVVFHPSSCFRLPHFWLSSVYYTTLYAFVYP